MCNSGINGNCGNPSLVQHMCNFIGQNVTIFTTSGGPSGCGFTGLLMSVNPCFCRLTTDIGAAPANPLSQSICPCNSRPDKGPQCASVGSVCDIPIEKIAVFCHNAI